MAGRGPWELHASAGLAQDDRLADQVGQAERLGQPGLGKGRVHQPLRLDARHAGVSQVEALPCPEGSGHPLEQREPVGEPRRPERVRELGAGS